MKSWLTEKIRGNEKIIGAAVTIPIVAAGAMSGTCAAGCPYGLVNDPYPGQCSRYIDVTGDGICDLSQTATASTSTDTTTSTTDSSDQLLSNGHGSDTNAVDQNDSINASAATDSGSGLEKGAFGDDGSYHVLPISILILGAYLFTHFLFSRGVLNQQKHRRIWNLLLTAGYLGTGITGILLTLMINLGIRTALNPSITFWHAELSILMVVGTLIHIHIYKKPFKKMFKVLFGFNSSKNKGQKPMEDPNNL